jgi:hypothetical protein
MADPKVDYVGMAALMHDLQRAGSDSGPIAKALQQVGQTALQPVASAARGRLPQTSGRLAGDVRVYPNRAGATMAVGRPSIRYTGWVEFGGTRRRPHTSTRDYSSTGRYIIPAARTLSGKVPDLDNTALTKAFDTFNWTNSGGGSPHD